MFLINAVRFIHQKTVSYNFDQVDDDGKSKDVFISSLTMGTNIVLLQTKQRTVLKLNAGKHCHSLKVKGQLYVFLPTIASQLTLV